ncbi:MAG TPA: GcrA family cell cycle regulator, partial [Alphaproteobacteria bacterium]|nr:GcrA family cell cycle regulator [Alphaproteobacteria bacterium]
MSWTDQRIEALRKFWQQGFSASQIAKKLGGVTRNAVIGKAHRLGLTGRSSSLKKQERNVTTESVPTYYQQIIDTTDKDTSGKPCMWPVGDPKQS